MLSTEDVEFIKRRALEIAADLDAKEGPRVAEIVTGQAPCWNIIVTQPNCERMAMEHLAERRFGVFLPTFTEERVMRGRKREIARLLFPGYLFVFVWDIEAHRRRIQACDGIKRVLRDGRERPVVVSDEVIRDIQLLETTESHWFQKRPRRRKGRRAVVHDLKENEVRIYTPSAWAGIEKLDPARRIGKLHRALGLVS